MVRIGKTLGQPDGRPPADQREAPDPDPSGILRELAGLTDDEAAAFLDRLPGRAQAGPGRGPDRGVEPARGRAPPRQVHGGLVRHAVAAARSKGVGHDAGPRPGSSASTVAGHRRPPGWPTPMGVVLGRGVAGPAPRTSRPSVARPPETTLDRSIARRPFADARRSTPRVSRSACLGLAGFDRPEDRRWLQGPGPRRRSLGRPLLILVNDGELVVAAGRPRGGGVGVIAGTGSIAVGRSTATAGRPAPGGWGLPLRRRGEWLRRGPGRASQGGATARRWSRPRLQPRPRPPDPAASATALEIDSTRPSLISSDLSGRGRPGPDRRRWPLAVVAGVDGRPLDLPRDPRTGRHGASKGWSQPSHGQLSPRDRPRPRLASPRPGRKLSPELRGGPSRVVLDPPDLIEAGHDGPRPATVLELRSNWSPGPGSVERWKARP